MKSYTLKGIECICGAFLIHFSLGTMYTFGNMSPYMASYLRFKTTNTWVTTGHTVWILAGTFFLMGLIMAVGGIMEKRFGSRLTCLFGCWSMSLCVMLTYVTIKKSLLLVIITYGLGMGFGLGMSYTVALTAAMKWFPNQRGMVSGIVVGGFGLGSFLFNLVQTKIINPTNIPPRSSNFSLNITNLLMTISNFSGTSTNGTEPSQEKYFFDDSILDSVPRCFLIIGGAYALIQLVGVILLMDQASSMQSNGILLNKLNGADQSKAKNIDESDVAEKKVPLLDNSVKKEAEPDAATKDYTVSRSVKSKMFWLLFTTFFLNGFVIVLISAVYKSFGQQFISDDQYFAILGAVGGICNCAGRVVWGRLNDKFGYRIVMSALTVLLSATIGTFFFCSFIPNPTAAKAIYFIYGCLLFIALSGTFAILPCATAQCFGSTNLSTIYGLIFIGLACASIVGAIVSSFFFHIFKFHGQFIMATIAAILSLGITQFYRPPLAQADKDAILADINPKIA